MSLRLCAADDCRQPFEPVYEQQATQRYCSRECATRMRVRRFRERHKPKPNGGGPGGRLLFPRSEMHRRKPAKSAMKPKPKQDGLFPEDGATLYASFGGAASYNADDSVSGNGRYNKYSVKSAGSRPSVLHSSKPEADLAA